MLGKLWASFKTFMLVTLVTVMVWVFAESETLRTQELTAQLIFEPLPDGDSALLTGPNRGGRTMAVTLVVEGPAAKIERAEQRFRTPIILTPGEGVMPRTTGEHSLDLLAVLRAEPEVDVLGVSVQRVEPEITGLYLDELVTRELPVETIVPDAELAVLPVPRPATVRITLPARQAARLPAGLVAQAVLDRATVARLAPGSAETVPGVAVRLPVVEGVDPDRIVTNPASVDVQLTVRTRTVEVVIPRVAVQLRIAPAELERFDVTIPAEDRFLTDVRVSGPADLVQQVQTGAIPVAAVVVLTLEDLERRITSKDAVFAELPTALRFGATSRTVRLQIRPRSSR